MTTRVRKPKVTYTGPTLTVEQVVEAIDIPFEQWSHQCHAISISIVKSDLIEGPRRVARGSCNGVGGQHSWVVVGDDCYAENAQIIDPTLWSYRKDVEGIWYGTPNSPFKHTPFGSGSIFEYGKPVSQGGPPIELTPSKSLSREAALFLRLLGPLDREGWSMLLHAPVGFWPAREIIEAADDTSELCSITPIDILGMVTDRNPHGLYLPGDRVNPAWARDDDGNS